ncbi:aminoacyl-tRNA deacylase [Actinoplanes sp. N902-109]|uniref:aminoacyl-tRNA deacylase n=1 Tax=Actinoplanes sp. (strain N902-109) TaxID=649831 RepID=UPI00032947E4|nr:YbaK/EbsC family protein [Actinoplanes sp. N902-109]AGL18057.1 YbaK/prolyl-tRNA synthetase associated region [Actinoplanes sp. N902-109]
MSAITAVSELGLTHEVLRHGPVRSVEEAAQAQGVEVGDLVKSLVVRRATDDYLFVLVPGDRQISWPKLRTLLGVNRLSMPDAAVAKEVTGYERGTITPFGSLRPWPVIADERLRGRTISLGAGERGVGLRVAADEAVKALDGTWADVTDPA